MGPVEAGWEPASTGPSSAVLKPLMLSLLAPRGRPFVIGHRGAMGLTPENTLASFGKALDLGVDAVELDVHLSLDGEVVVIHDGYLERTTDGRGMVRDHTLTELKGLDAGAHFGEAWAGERIPTLREVFDRVADQVPVIIEIKNNPLPYAGIEARVVEEVLAANLLDRVQIISFDHPTVRRVRDLRSDVATGLLYAGRPLDAVTLARSAGATALCPHWSYVQALEVRMAHQVGLSVHPWVTGDPDVVRHLVTLDVDSIATNHPDIVLEALGRVAGEREIRG